MRALPATDGGLTVQRRALPLDLRKEVLRLALEDDLRIVVDGSPERVGGELGELFDDCPAFRADLLALLERFLALTGRRTARLRVERIAGDACRRWHADDVVMRLLCTYVGQGTQILPMPEAASVLAGSEPATTATAWPVGTGDVVVLPGRRHPTAVPVVHRSPPIAGTGDVRLLLVIDDGSPAD
jgi:hypothetical protein